MDLSKDNSKAIEDLQVAEHSLQEVLGQKQMFQVEIQEIDNALKELKDTKDEVYRILSGIMIRSNKVELIKELDERKKIGNLRIDSIEKQEKILEEKSLKLRDRLKETIAKDKR